MMLLLSLADSLNSLQLIGTITALLWFVVAVETWGNAEKCHVWVGEECKREYVCKYNLRCLQGEEQIPDEVEDELKEDGDIGFSV